MPWLAKSCATLAGQPPRRKRGNRYTKSIKTYIFKAAEQESEIFFGLVLIRFVDIIRLGCAYNWMYIHKLYILSIPTPTASPMTLLLIPNPGCDQASLARVISNSRGCSSGPGTQKPVLLWLHYKFIWPSACCIMWPSWPLQNGGPRSSLNELRWRDMGWRHRGSCQCSCSSGLAKYGRRNCCSCRGLMTEIGFQSKSCLLDTRAALEAYYRP